MMLWTQTTFMDFDGFETILMHKTWLYGDIKDWRHHLALCFALAELSKFERLSIIVHEELFHIVNSVIEACLSEQ